MNAEATTQREDAELSKHMYRAVRALEDAGLSAQDIIDELPSAGMALMRQWYGDAFVDELEREHQSGAHGAAEL